MKKSNLINKNIVRAMSAGISAVMMFSSISFSAFADTETPGSTGTQNPDPQPANNEQNTGVETKSELTKALEAIGQAEVDVNTAISGETNSVNAALSQAETVQNNTNIANQGIGTAAGNLSEEVDGLNLFGTAKDNEKTDAAETIHNAGVEASTLEGQQLAIDVVVNDMNDAVAEANKQAGIANDAVDPAKDTLTNDKNETIGDVVDGADTVLTDAEKTISTSDDLEEIGNKYDGAVKAVGDADNQVNDTEAAFLKAKKDYDDAVAAYNAACARFGADGDTLFGENPGEGLVGGYDATKATAESEIKATSDELEKLEKELAALKKAANDAKVAYEQTRYGYIAKLEADAEANPNWDTYRKVADAMADYYVTEVLQGTVTGKEAWKDWNNTWKKQGYSEEYIYERDGETVVSTPGNTLNYATIKYTVKNEETGELEEKELLYNYKTVEHNAQSVTKDGKKTSPGIVLFEKVKHNVIGAEELTDEQLAILDRNEAIFNEDNTSVLVKEGDNYVRYSISEVDCQRIESENLNLGYSNFGEETTQLSGTASEVGVRAELKDENGNVIGYTITDTYYTTSTGIERRTDGNISATYTYDEDGNVIKTETQNIKEWGVQKTVKTTTTTTYTGATLDGQAAGTAKYADEATAKSKYIEALQAKVDDLKDGETLVIGEGENAVEFKKGDTVENAVGYTVSTDSELTGYAVGVTYHSEKFTKTRTQTGWGVNNETAKAAYKTLSLDEKAELELKYDLSLVQRKYDILGDITEDFVYEDTYIDIEEEIKIPFIGTKTISVHKKTGENCIGTITANVVKLSSITIDKDWLWLRGVKDGDISKAKGLLEAEGKTYVDYYAIDGKVDQYTVYYYVDDTNKTVIVDGDTVNDTTVRTAMINSELDPDNLQYTYDSSNKVAQYKTVYGYGALSYYIKTVAAPVQVGDASYVQQSYLGATPTVIATTNLNKEEASSNTLKVEYRNDNWYSGDILLAEYDKETGTDYTTDKKVNNKYQAKELNEVQSQQTADFRSLVDGAASDRAEYIRLSKEAEDAEAAVKAAQAKVDALKIPAAALNFNFKEIAVIGELVEEGSADETVNPFILTLAQNQLDEALKALEQAKTHRDNLLTRLAALEALYGARVAELTPAPAGPVTVAAVIPATTGETVAPAVPGALMAAPAPAPAPAPANADDQDNNAGDEDQNTETIENEESALAEGIGDKQTEDIGNEESALAMGLDEIAPKKKWNWWWLIIVAAVTGGTTYGIIKGNQKKKADQNKEV